MNRAIQVGQSALLAAAIVGCSDATQSSSGAASASSANEGVGSVVMVNGQPELTAFAGNFADFHSWTSTPGVGPPGAPNPSVVTDGGIHAGTLTTYINQMPPAGSTSFPVGTIIVKEQDQPPLTQRQTFAMVKRGGDFNATGAVNWEWFELQNLDESSVSIIWRGYGPVGGGESYGGNPAVCNDCHEGASANDFVWTAGLQLSSH